MLKKDINENMEINIGKLMGISGLCTNFINPSWTNSLAIKQGKIQYQTEICSFCKVVQLRYSF